MQRQLQKNKVFQAIERANKRSLRSPLFVTPRRYQPKTRMALLACALGLPWSGGARADDWFTVYPAADANKPGIVWNPVRDQYAPGYDATNVFGGLEPAQYYSIFRDVPAFPVAMNNAMPIFGLPGTIVSPDFRKRTQLTGDWNGARTELANKGVFFDLYTTSGYQYVGKGQRTSSAFLQNIQANINVDFGQMGVIAGGLFHVTIQANPGSNKTNMYATGESTFSYTGLAIPEPQKRSIGVHEFYYVQHFNKYLTTITGKADPVFLADQTIFGSSFQLDWSNFTLSGANPMLSAYTGTDAYVFFARVNPVDSVTITAGITDPYSKASNFAYRALRRINYYMQVGYTYQIGNLPGQIMPSFNWSNQPYANLEYPTKDINSVKQILDNRFNQTAGSVYDSMQSQPKSYLHNSFIAMANFSQYIWVKDADEVVGYESKNGLAVRGLGIQGRFGQGPAKTNVIDRHYNIGLYGLGLWDERPRDRYGFAFFYDGISKYLRNNFNSISIGNQLRDETGIEGFYNLSLAESISLIASYQHIWNPTYASAMKGSHRSDVFMTRLNVVW